LSRWIYLSYFLDNMTPAYGGGETFKSVSVRSMELNDACNAMLWKIPNHVGTHIDCPRHFSKNGKTLDNFSAQFWIFHSVCLLDISPIDFNERINKQTLTIESIDPRVELLLIKTGFCELRNDARYWNSNPAFSYDLADALRQHCPHLRVIGFDTISLSSWSDRTMGRIAHRAFLDHDCPILVLEDMDLMQVGSDTVFLQVIVSPLLVMHADASPCNVMAEIVE